MRCLECGSQAVTERPERHRPVLSVNGGMVHHPTIKQAGKFPTLAYQAILELAAFGSGRAVYSGLRPGHGINSALTVAKQLHFAFPARQNP